MEYAWASRIPWKKSVPIIQCFLIICESLFLFLTRTVSHQSKVKSKVAKKINKREEFTFIRDAHSIKQVHTVRGQKEQGGVTNCIP